MNQLIVLSLILLALSCNQSDEKKVSQKQEQTVATETNPNAEKGLELVAKSDCFTCHKIDQRLNGPSYMEIAAKYPSNEAVLDSLAEKIIKGGSGNWGSVLMTPHPAISKDSAKLMVEYILSLKNTQ